MTLCFQKLILAMWRVRVNAKAEYPLTPRGILPIPVMSFVGLTAV